MTCCAFKRFQGDPPLTPASVSVEIFFEPGDKLQMKYNIFLQFLRYGGGLPFSCFLTLNSNNGGHRSVWRGVSLGLQNVERSER